MDSRPTLMEKCVTFVSGSISFGVVLHVFTRHSVPVATKGPASWHDISNLTACYCNVSSNSRLEHAKSFEEALAGKNFVQRLRHRLTHREEAVEATIFISSLLIIMVVSLLYTKMWRDKQHHPLTFKQPVKYPHGDKSEEILVKDMLKARAKTFTEIFRLSRTEGKPMRCDEADGNEDVLRIEDFLIKGEDAFTPQQLCILESSSGEENGTFDLEDTVDWSAVEFGSSSSSEDGQVYVIDSRSGEWKAQRQPLNQSKRRTNVEGSLSETAFDFGKQILHRIPNVFSLGRKKRAARTRSRRRATTYEDDSSQSLLLGQDEWDSDTELLKRSE